MDPILDASGGAGAPDMAAILAKLSQSHENMMTVVANQGQMMQNLQGTLGSLTETLKGGLNIQQPAPKEPELDLTTADQGQVAQFILREVGKMVNAVKEDFTGQIKGIKLDQARSTNKTEFEKLQSDPETSDVTDWLPEMRDLATNNPNLNLKQLLNLARVENPEKHTKLQATRKEKELEGKPKDEEVGFGGMTPTSGFSVDLKGGDGKTKKVSVSEAVNKAWETVIPGSMKKELAANHDPLF